MSRDEFSLPTVTGAEETPGLGGLALPQQAAEGISLRTQVIEPINDVLFDLDPEGEGARSPLRRRTSPLDNPERAFLEHLIATEKYGQTRPLPGGAGTAPAGLPVDRGTRDGGTTKRVMSVLLTGGFFAPRSRNERAREGSLYEETTKRRK